ncbi:MAG: hypothetical protein IJB46_07150 [Prevotella sp.]|nr:hypothetical protein [Prevotella sp.]
MRKSRLLFTLLCGVMLTIVTNSCSDDNSGSGEWNEGANVELPSYRGFVLSEGAFGKNNSHLFYFDPAQDTIYTKDIYETQNGRKLGDTANDMLVCDGDIYIIVNVSKLLLRLNGSGVEQVRYTNFDELGEPRSMVEEDGKLYVTCYGGYVARFDAKTLTLEAKVKVDANPEQIVESDNKLYCVNSGFGLGNTMSVIDIENFNKSESVEIVTNPFGIQETDGAIFIMAYDEYYNTYISRYNSKSGKCEKIADGTKMYADDGKLYIANATTSDWVNYTTEYSIYDVKTGTTSKWNLKNAPSEMFTSVAYMIEKNPYDNSVYISLTDYVSNGKVYHFDSSDKYVGNFSAGGINPNSIAFIR